LDSKTSTLKPAFWRRIATDKPAIPAPITITFLGFFFTQA